MSDRLTKEEAESILDLKNEAFRKWMKWRDPEDLADMKHWAEVLRDGRGTE